MEERKEVIPKTNVYINRRISIGDQVTTRKKVEKRHKVKFTNVIQKFK